ncbi:MAG TPA: cupin [Sphingomonas bacterium]|jgi:cupin 2 domain-containing protein|uniref:Cupin n=1 Tax=Sphingomonas bacterium TaxID=1895847 RepID=A0A3D0W8Y9_9SPHN|nr:cupin [Sphingomonas bacterium]
MTNLLHPLPDASGGEVFEDLLTRPGCRIERIVSLGQVTPPNRPYVQPHDEWVLVLAGRAVVEVEGAATALWPGDPLLIPAGAAHRVTFTDPDVPTVWLAMHFG